MKERAGQACSYCDENYETSGNLQTHVTFAHGDHHKHLANSAKNTLFTNSDLSIDIKNQHTGENSKIYTHNDFWEGSCFSLVICLKTILSSLSPNCDKCGKTFTSTSILADHNQCNHSATQPQQCQICNQAFTLKSGLTKHIAEYHVIGTSLPSNFVIL